MLEALLPAHPDLSIRNRFGGVSVIPASERGHVEYVRRVVTTGIDVNHVNDLGWTAMLEAVILGDGGPRHREVVRILLAAGANRSIADKDGVTRCSTRSARAPRAGRDPVGLSGQSLAVLRRSAIRFSTSPSTKSSRSGHAPTLGKMITMARIRASTAGIVQV